MKMREQRWMGLVMVVISWLLLTIAAGGETLEERDATAVLLTLPLGLYMMFGETLVLYQDDAPASAREPPGGAVPSYQAGAESPVLTITTERKELINGKKKSN